MEQVTKKRLEGLSKNQLIEIILNQQAHIKALSERVSRLEKDSKTSSKPPSGDEEKPKPNQSLRWKSGKPPGGQLGHKGQTREPVIPDEVKHCFPEEACSHCETILDVSLSECVEARQEVEIPPIKAYVIEHQKMAITCSCGHYQTGQFPEDIRAHIQLGSHLKSFLVYLNVAQLIPYKRLTDVMSDLFGTRVCKRSIENSLEQAATKAEPVYKQIMDLIKQSKWVGSDETGKRVKGKRWWEWVWQSTVASYYAIDQSRGYQVVKTHFGEDYSGTLCHDCWSAHNNTVAKAGHQQCHPHIQRDLQFLIKAYKSSWAYHLNNFLSASQKARDIIWKDGFCVVRRNAIICTYQAQLQSFLVKNGFNDDVLRLQKRIIKHKKSILHFMTDPEIPFHNNSSERAIRMAKVKQKISGGFRSQRGAQRHSILLSVIETAKKQNMNILEAIQKVFNQSLVFKQG